MLYLADTNVLLRFIDSEHLLHERSTDAIKQIQQGEHELKTTLQNCAEFWNVVTRPIERNGLGLTVSQADHSLALLEKLFPILPDTPAIYTEWRRLVVTYSVSGVQVHDARLVAAMKTHGVTHILTFNVVDFQRYADEEIIAVDPLAF
jgi:predicted nucleic acid-binding protein